MTTKRLATIGLDASILLLFASLVSIVWRGQIWYWSGVTNRSIVEGLPFAELLPYALISLLLLACIAAMSVRLILRWKVVPVWGRVVRCGIMLLMCVGVIGAFGFRVRGIDKFAQGFEQKMRREADVKAIRAWASGLVVPAEEGVVPSVPENLWSESVTALSPQEVYYAEDVMGVRLDWGGGFMGHYGLVVGPENMEIPNTTEMELIMPLEAGAYLFFPNG